jgi:hypothetical protein
MALGLRQLLGRSNLTPRLTGTRVEHPPKPTNPLELGWEQWAQRVSLYKAWCAPRTPIYAHRRSPTEDRLERIGTYYHSPQKAVALWMICWPRARAQTLSITRPTAGPGQKGGCPRPKVGNSQMSLPSPHSIRRPMRHKPAKGIDTIIA